MSDSGLSKARLARMHDVLAGHVANGLLPGLVTLISRRGETLVDPIGTTALGGTQPMRPDTIFRIASLSKPFAAVATLMLIEECKVRLDEPVQRLLPELADRQVLVRADGPLGDTVPATRPITVRDLLTFRAGWGLIFDESPFAIEVRAQGLVGFGPPVPDAKLGPDEWLAKLGDLPLLHQPGAKWMYNTGSYILGVLISRASGQPVEEFLAERIFGTLGMKDTRFHVPADKVDRLAAHYWAAPETDELQLSDAGGPDSPWTRPPVFPDLGGGLVSTIEDFAAFARLLRNKGKYNGERLLSRPSVEAMTTDQLTPEQKAVSGFFPGTFDARGWGFGVSVTTKREGLTAIPGQYGWDGGYGTTWYTDPAEDLFAIQFTQRGQFPLANPVHLDFWTGVYQAIDD